MIHISSEDLKKLVRESFEEGFHEGVQKGRGFNAAGWEDSHARGKLETFLNAGSAETKTGTRRFLDQKPDKP